MDNLESLFSKLAVSKSGNERDKQRIIEDLQAIKDEPEDIHKLVILENILQRSVEGNYLEPEIADLAQFVITMLRHSIERQKQQQNPM